MTSDKHYDALVIGSGAAGSTAVKELTERGLEVLLLEAGRDVTERDFPPLTTALSRSMGVDLWPRLRSAFNGQHIQSRRSSFRVQDSKFLVNDRQHPYVTDQEPFLWIRGRQLGGRLHTYGRTLLRFSDKDFKPAARDDHGDDWPISYNDVERYYDEVEEFTGIYGNRDDLASPPDGRYRGPSPLNTAEREFRQKVEEHWPERHVISWRWAAPNPHRIPLGIVVARDTGRLTVQTDAIVRRITVNPKSGLADGALYIDRLTKREHRVSVDLVFVCASTIESVRLLFNSACERHPNGLGNSSGVLGRYFMDQTHSLLFGTDPSRRGFELENPGPEDPYYQPAGGVYIPRFDDPLQERTRGYARGWTVQGMIGRLPVPADFPAIVALLGFGEMMATPENRITVDTRRVDAWGIPVPRISVKLGPNDRALLAAQVADTRELAEYCGYRVNFNGSSLGLDSKEVWPDADPFSRWLFRASFRRSLAVGAAIHECGGARMGNDPTRSVLNAYNQAWDVPNLFVTDGSAFVTCGAAGPALTIMALTARACEYAAHGYDAGTLGQGTTRR